MSEIGAISKSDYWAVRKPGQRVHYPSAVLAGMQRVCVVDGGSGSVWASAGRPAERAGTGVIAEPGPARVHYRSEVLGYAAGGLLNERDC
jgi:hypothetical protein